MKNKLFFSFLLLFCVPGTGLWAQAVSAITGTASVCQGATTGLNDATNGGVWSSSNTSAGTIDTYGDVTGISGGTTTISYTVSGISATITFTINPAAGPITLSGLDVSIDAIGQNINFCEGESVTLGCTPTGGAWSISDVSVATIDPSSGVVTPGTNTGSWVTISYTSPTGCGASWIYAQTNAAGEIPIDWYSESSSYYDFYETGGLLCTGDSTAATMYGTWTSSNSSVASVNNVGMATGLSGGTSTIYFTSSGGGCYGTSTVYVTQTPQPISGPATVCVGDVVTLTDATPLFTGSTQTSYWEGYEGWNVTIAPEVPGSFGTPGSPATYVAISTGLGSVWFFTYGYDGCFSRYLVTVVSPPSPPDPIGGPTTVCVGAVITLNDDVAGGNWNGSGSNATIDGSGDVTGVSPGTQDFTYNIPSVCASGSASVSTTVTVNAAPAAITGPTSVCVGGAISLSDATTGGAWGSSGGVTVDGSGNVSGVTAGTGAISYTAGGCPANVTVTVNAGPGAISGADSVNVGATTTLNASTAGGTWSSNSPSVGTVGPSSGVVGGVTAGTANITYTLAGGCSIYITVTVNPIPGPITGDTAVVVGSTTVLSDAVSGGVWSSEDTTIATTDPSTILGISSGFTYIDYTLHGVTVRFPMYVVALIAGPTPPAVCINSTILLTDFPPGGSWSSSNGHATVDGSGNVTGVSAGTATISYTVLGVSPTLVVTVLPLPNPITFVFPGLKQMCSGATITLTDATTGGAWSISGSASIDGSGNVTGVTPLAAPGTAVITYTTGGCSVTTSVTVYPIPGPIGGPSVVCSVGTITLTDAVSGGTWSSTIPGFGTVDGSGDVTGLSAGVTNIYYTLYGVCQSTPFPVTVLAPLSGITSVSGAYYVCAGSTVTYTDAPGGGAWSSNDETIATVDPITGDISGAVLSGPPVSTFITYTLPGGCYNNKIVTVFQVPTPIVGPATVCANAAITLSDAVWAGTWSDSNPAAGTISNVVGVSTVLTGTGGGPTTISYVNACGSVSLTVTVNPVIPAITGGGSVCGGGTIALNDAAQSSSYNILSGVTTWTGLFTSGNTSIATVDPITGVVTGGAVLSTMTVPIYYSLFSSLCAVSTIITVNPTPAAIIATPGVVCTNSTILLTDASSGGSWGSLNTAVATVGYYLAYGTSNDVEEITGVTAGTATITYSLAGGCYASTIVTVNQSPSFISNGTGLTYLCAGVATTYTSTPTTGTWSIADGTVATITTLAGAGIVTGAQVTSPVPNITTITYTLPTGCSRTASISVYPSPGPISGPASVCVGASITLTDAVGDAASGYWMNDAPAVGSFSTATGTAGVFAGLSAGATNITYELNGRCNAYAVVTVNPLPSFISNGTGTPYLCAGVATTYTSTPTTGTWSIADGTVATIATVAGAGIVTGTQVTSPVPNITTITYTLPTGCYRTGAISVYPSPRAISGQFAVCTNKNATLNNSLGSPTTGSWTNDLPNIGSFSTNTGTAGVFVGLMAGTTNVTYTLNGRCNAYVVETVNQTPSPIIAPAVVCAGTTFTISDAYNPGGASWGNPYYPFSELDPYFFYPNYADVTVGIPPPAGTKIVINYGIASTGCNVQTTINVVNCPPGVTTLPITPSFSMLHGSPGATLAVTGSGFNTTPASNSVYFGNTDPTPTAASDSSLMVTVPAGSTYGTVSVTNLATGYTGYSRLFFLPGYDNSLYLPGMVNMNPYVNFAATPGAQRVLMADINGDEKPDMVVLNYSSNTVSVFPNTSTSGAIDAGSFGAKVDFATGAGPSSIAVADINADGRPEMIITNSLDNTVSIFNNTDTNGVIDTNSFAAKVDFATGNNPSGVAIGNLDGLGWPDLVITNAGSNTVSVLQNAEFAHGALTDSSYLAHVDFATGAGPSSVAVVDIDGDSWPDIVVANDSANTISILQNVFATGSTTSISSSSFAAKVDFAAGANPVGLVIGDIDGDGNPDIIVANSGSSSVSVFRNTATSGAINGGSLAAKVDFATGANPASIAIGDIDGDGKPDVVAGNMSTGSVSVLRNTAASGSISGGSFAGKVDFATGSGPQSVAVCDVDGDNKPDVITANGGSAVLVLMNNPLRPINGNTAVCTGGSINLIDSTNGGSWSSANASIATIGATGIVTGVAMGTVTISYTVAGGSATTTVTINTSAPNAGTITGPGSVTIGSGITLTDIAAGGVWAASNSDATVSGGVVTGVSAGTVTISYTVTGSCGTASAIKVVSVNAASIPGITGIASVCVANSTTLTDAATGGAWSSNIPSVATVGATTGVVTGVVPGTATVSYTLSGTTTTVVVTVSGNPAVITGASTVCMGATKLLTDVTTGGAWSSTGTAGSVDASGNVTGMSAGTITVSYQTGSCAVSRITTINPSPSPILGIATVCNIGGTTNLSDATTGATGWASSNTAFATVNGGGVVTGVAVGSAAITYTIATGCSVTTMVTIGATAGAINGNAPVCAGSSMTLTDGTGAGAWNSSNATIATVGSGTGNVTGIAGGTATVTYVGGSNGCKTTAVVTVNAIAAISGSLSTCIGSAMSLSDGTSGGTWSSDNSGVASVGPATGVVTGGGGGTANITYLIAATGCSRAVSVTINATASAISGPGVVCAGSTITLTDATAGGTWSGSNAVIATVGTSSGIVTPVNAGTVNISYHLGGCNAVQVVTVTYGPATITGPSSVCLGFVVLLGDVTASGSWSSTNPGVGSVDGSGNVTGLATGSTTISYSIAAGCASIHTFTVNPLPTAINGTKEVCAAGATTNLADATTGATGWTSSNTSAATVNGGGVVTGVAMGTTIITYKIASGCAITTMVTVNALPSAGTISGPTTVSHSGSTITLVDATTGGIWTSQHTGIATVGSTTGIVTAVTISGSDNISYTITDVNACKGVAIYSITATPAPPHSGGTTVGGGTTISVGDVVSIAADANSGEWSSSNTGIATVDGSGVVTGIAPGAVNITQVIKSGAGVTTIVSPVVVNALPIDVRVIPNPNNGSFTVKGTLGTLNDEEVMLEITDVLGQVIYKNRVMAQRGEINEHIQLNNGLANGTYILNVKSATENKVFHFVVER